VNRLGDEWCASWQDKELIDDIVGPWHAIIEWALAQPAEQRMIFDRGADRFVSFHEAGLGGRSDEHGD
jgi:hypothetical protein